MVTTRSRGPVEPHQPEMQVDEAPAGHSLASLAGQKRPRDYGEELKGLTPERESDTGGSPSAKKPRREPEEVEAKDAQSDDLDDGEIVETIVPGQATDPETVSSNQADAHASVPAQLEPEPEPEFEHEPAAIKNAAADDSNLPNKPAVTAQDEVTRSMPPSDEQAAIKAGPDQSHGENVEAVAGLESAETKKDAEQSHASSSNWNQGVGIGLRTSFAKAPSKPDKVTPVTAPGIMSFPMMNKDWKVNATKFDQVVCDSELDHAKAFKPHFWKQWMESNLEQVILVLQEDNDFDFASISKPAQKVKLVRNAMLALIQPSGGILQGTKKKQNIARTVAQPVFDELTHKTVNKKLQQLSKPQNAPTTGQKEVPEVAEESLQESKEAEEAKKDESVQKQESPDAEEVEPGEIESDDSSPPSPEELEHRRLYFPGSENYPRFCIHCVSTKHNSSSCPQLACQFCGSVDHAPYGCPTKQRCNKCRQIGHSKDTCQEKIALAKEEMEPCAYCGLPHVEDQCVKIWKSFDPTQVEIRKVRSIPAFCYICGNEGHYGPECGLSARGPDIESELSIWSSATRDFYVDPSSSDVAIAWAGLDTNQIQPGQNFSIRGQAKKKTHVYYVSSDDSDDGFIQEPVQKPAPRGNIQINTNASRPAPKRGGFSSLRQQSHRRQDQREFSPPPPPPLELYHDYTSWQPPLPAGPPPPTLPGAYTFQGNTGSLQQAPPGTLPARPGNQGYRNTSGSSQNGSKRGRGGRPRRNK